MPSRKPTRQSCTQLPRYKKSASISQRVAALRRVIVWEDSFAQAAAYVNAQSGPLAKERMLSKSTMRRLYRSLTPELQLAINADETALLDFIQEQQAARLG